MGIRVKILKDHPYSKGLKVGDSYEVSGQSQLALVKAMKWAEEEEPKVEVKPPKTPEPALKTSALTGPGTPVKTTTRGRRPASSYLTRDMTAEATQPDSIFPATIPMLKPSEE